jgi:error-prone DNA polymerase
MRDMKIGHIIRGSAGSSLVCFLLGITKIDPILFGLQLARFMNNGRLDLPDIDIDVPYNRREELFRRISETWPKQVAHISNYVTYGHKVALRELAKASLLSKMSEKSELRTPEEKKKLRALAKKSFKLETLIEDEAERKEILKAAQEKVGTLKNYSLHCGGIVIFEEEGEIPEELKLDCERDDGKIQLNLNKDDTEDSGFIKIDILSNRGLAILTEADEGKHTLLDYPWFDGKIRALFSRGDTIGLTFSESRGCRRVLMEMRPRHMGDVAIALAVIRPAAAGDGRKGAFLERWKKGAEEEDNPYLRPIVFDDDAIIRIQDLLKCDAATADRWRKVFAKEKKEEMRQFYLKLTLAGHSREICQMAKSDLEMLSYYSFCKSHAISYAQLVWALAWHKVYNTHKFWIAVLNHNHSDYRKWVMWREAKCSGLQLTREKGPWHLGVRNGLPAILSAQGTEQSLICKSATQDISDYRNLGYWLGDSFLKGCGIWPVAQRKIDSALLNKKDVRFCGIIACGRIYKRDSLLTFITIGTENGVFIDLIISGTHRDLFSWVGVQGTGTIKKEGTIEVDSIRGASLDICSKAS